MCEIEIDVQNHKVQGIQGSFDISGLLNVLGTPEKRRDDGDLERWFFECAIVDINKRTGLIELIDFTPNAPLLIYGRDPFRDPDVLNKLIKESTDW